MDRLVEPTSRGDPESPLRWTCKSVRQLAAALKRQGHQVSHRMVAELLHDMGYSLQANRKTLAGTEHPDRNAQFEHLDRAVQLQLSLGEPVISVDTKKKELVGPFKNGGRELRPKGAPEQVLVHDFLIPDLGRVSPYGVYDIAQNEAWVSVGTDHDTAAFAVESIRRWWRGIALPERHSAADNRKLELQKLAEGDQQVEQDRTPLVLRDQSELARKAAGQPRGGGELDRGDHDPDGAAGSEPTGHQPIPGRAHRIGRRTRSHLFA